MSDSGVEIEVGGAVSTPSEVSDGVRGYGKIPVTQEMFDYFLEVLPPRGMGQDWFMFQEGCGDRIMFRQEGKDSWTAELKAGI